ncbi:MAG: hypothetical protein M3O22_01100 [Pseudomonadota bacterium]|nr:hypothetical protein [Pseudomonadota bacterium]
MSKILDRIFFFVIPAFLFVLFFVVEGVLVPEQKKVFYSEYGPVEILQEAMLFLCLVFSIYILTRINPDQSKWLKIWIGIAALGCFYVFIEEISWGQKIFRWNTPEFWMEINTQRETNIHNTSQIFNRVPRGILETGILVAGIIIPVLRKYAPSALPKKISAIYPASEIMFISILATIIKILEHFPSRLGIQVFWRKSEVMETFFYCFVFLYLFSIFHRWVQSGIVRTPCGGARKAL